LRPRKYPRSVFVAGRFPHRTAEASIAEQLGDVVVANGLPRPTPADDGARPDLRLTAAASNPRIQMCILFISAYGRASRERLDFFSVERCIHGCSNNASAEISMRSFTKQQIASGVALVIAALFVVVLHSLNYSKEHQVYGIALVGVFGFLFLSRDKAQQQDKPWWW
jgi:hypothetical protein